MSDRKEEIAWLHERAAEIERKNQCHCGRGPKKAETELCQLCEEDAQADIIDADELQAHRIYAGDKR